MFVLAVEFTEENNDSLLSPSEAADMESPPVSPASTVSGPYIPISECITGKPLNTPLGMFHEQQSLNFSRFCVST